MKTLRHALPAACLIALSACGGDAGDPPTDLEVATTDGEAVALAQSIEAGSFADLKLGAKVAGPQGEELKSRLTNEAGAFADVTSYVACPAGMDPCDPANAPQGTVFTYVHIVYPGEDNAPDSGSGTGADASDVEQANRFMIVRSAYGFTGSAGYSKLETMAAIGPKAEVVITCVDGGIAWTVNAGEGGNQWEQSEPLTFWWQSTLPPAGPARAYAIEANYVTATGDGPYPAERAGATNACAAPSTTP